MQNDRPRRWRALTCFSHAPGPYAPTAMLLCGVTLILCIPFHIKPDNFCVDDGYFYLEIARNIVRHHESTFNGWLPTNGYHPLWMLVCCVCAWIDARSTALLQLVSGLQDVLLATSVAIIGFLANRDRLRGAVFGCILLWLTNDVLGIWRLLETDFALLLQLLVLLSVLSGAPSRRGHGIGYSLSLGILLGFMMLARLDLVFFTTVVLLFQLVDRHDESTQTRRAFSVVVQGASMTAVMLPYLAWNLSRFGHLMPVSGAVKSAFPHLQAHLRLDPGTVPVLLGALFGVYMLFRPLRTRFETAILLTGVGGGIHLIYTTSFGSASPWYFTTGYLAFSLSMIWTANFFLRSATAGEWVEATALTAVVLIFLLVAGIRSETKLSFTRLFISRNVKWESGYVDPRRAFAELLRATYAPGTRFFIFDSPGSVAYYSGMSITSADGLIEDYRWNDEVARTGLTAYAKANDMNFFVVPILREGQNYDWLSLTGTRYGVTQTMQYTTPYGKRDGGSVTLRDQDIALTTRTIQPGFESTYPLLGVWRLP